MAMNKSYLFTYLNCITLFAILVSNYSYGLEAKFSGIAKLSNCSGTLIQFKNQRPSNKGILLTNGHCVIRKGGAMLGPREVLVNRKALIYFSLFDENGELHEVRSKKLIYATIYKTDIALFEIDKTYTELSLLGIKSWELENERPLLGQSIEILSGYLETTYQCFIDKFIYSLEEGAYLFKDSIRFSSVGCETIGGSSGSPVIALGTRRVIGINNTHNVSGRCSKSQACERDEFGERNIHHGSYGQQTYQIYNCLNPDFQLNLNNHNCRLPKNKY
jgi:hypothetical protein